MAKLQAHGDELHRYFSISKGALLSVRADGVTLYRTPFTGGWEVLLRKKADVPLQQWKDGKARLVAGLAAWQREIKGVPSMATLQAWEGDGICDTPTGHQVEPDGKGPDGVPSWLRLFGLI